MKVEYDHYNDGLIDVRNIPEFNLWVFLDNDGHMEQVSYDDNFFAPIELVKAYRRLYGCHFLNDKSDYIGRFKLWLKSTGVESEKLAEQTADIDSSVFIQTTHGDYVFSTNTFDELKKIGYESWFYHVAPSGAKYYIMVKDNRDVACTRNGQLGCKE